MRFLHRRSMIAVDIVISDLSFAILLPSTQHIFSPSFRRRIEVRHGIRTETVVLGNRPAGSVGAGHEPHGIFHTAQRRKPSRGEVHGLEELGGEFGVQFIEELIV